MARSRTALIVVFFLLASGACSSSDEDSQTLDGTEYWSTAVVQNGEPLRLVNGTNITLAFNGGSLSAHAGCNSIGGEFEVQDGRLRTTDLSMTEMGCDPERSAQDVFLIELLEAAPMITIDGDILRLVSSSASVDFLDAALANPDLPLQDTTWQIDGFLSGQTSSAIATDLPGTLRIEDGVMQLFDGCATTDLPVEIDGSDIRFTPVSAPAVEGCDAPAGYRQSIFTALSRGVLGYEVNGASLTVATPDNVGLTLRAAE